MAWDRMAGDERVRHCTACDLDVYNFASMTSEEIRELVLRTEGRLCGRLYRRADGTLLTRDCPTKLQAVRRRLSRWSAAVIATLFGVSAFSTGCATSRQNGKIKLDVQRVETAQQPLFGGVVQDETGQPLPGVFVSLRNQAGQELLGFTDERGTFRIPDLTAGTYRVEVSLAGLEPVVMERLALKEREATHAKITLRAGRLSFETVGEIIVDVGSAAGEPMSTTFPQDFIDKMPLP